MDRVKSLKNGEYEYSEKDKLGEGSFAHVYKGIITKNNRVVAVRLLPLTLIKQYGDKIKDIISGEVGVLKDLSLSDSIDAIFTTRIYDCFMTANNVVMILEFCPDGNLEDVMKKGPLDERDALEILYQLARGLEFIAQEKVVHRDIKPDNIFVKKESHHSIFKLGDFGFAVKKQLNHEIVGTPIFMSPELFREEKYGSEVDVWAFGLMAHYMLFKEYYFIGATEQQIKNKVLKDKYTLKSHHTKKISKEMGDFLTSCLQMDKRDRMPATKIAQHPVFRPVKEKVELMIAEVRMNSSLMESELSKKTAKGQMTGEILKFNFLLEFAGRLAKLDFYNLTSLYIYKHALGELDEMRNNISNGVNVIGHPDWRQFTQTPDFAKASNLLKAVLQRCEKDFEMSFNNIIPMVQNRYGPSVANGIQENLGHGPFAKINPRIITHELENTWYARLKESRTPETHFVGLQLILALSLYSGKQVSFDFTKWEMKKESMSLPESTEYFESSLKSM